MGPSRDHFPLSTLINGTDHRSTPAHPCTGIVSVLSGRTLSRDSLMSCIDALFRAGKWKHEFHLPHGVSALHSSNLTVQPSATGISGEARPFLDSV